MRGKKAAGRWSVLVELSGELASQLWWPPDYAVHHADGIAQIDVFTCFAISFFWRLKTLKTSIIAGLNQNLGELNRGNRPLLDD